MKSRDDIRAMCEELPFPENPLGLPHPLQDYRFVRDWLAGESGATEILPPFDPTWRQAIARRDAARPEPLRPDELDELREFNLACGNTAGAALVPALGQAETLAVVAGQQPNLLASPLFVLTKAVATVRLAQHISRLAGRRVVPIFWVASDDHDFAELAQCYVLGRSGSLRNLAVLVVRRGAFEEASPAYAWNLDPVASALSEMLRAELPAGSARAATLDAVERALRAPATFESVFCRLLAAYLEHEPIILLAPRLRFMRRRQIPLLERELADFEATNRAVAEGARRLTHHGYRAQIHRRLHDLNFFYMLDNVRCRLAHKGKRVIVEHPRRREPITTFAYDELAAHASRHWGNFSPNVVLRPLVQDFVLPTIAYVAGPAELTYLAQIRPVFELFGVTLCQPVLRPMVTVISSGARQTLDRMGAWEAFLQRGLDGVLETIVEGDARLGDVVRRLREYEDRLQMDLSTLGNTLASEHPHLVVAFEKTRHHVAYGLKKLRQRILRQFRPPDEGKCRDLCSVFTEIAPMASAQERVLSALSFGYEMGPQQLAAVMAQALEGWGPRPDPIVLALSAPRQGQPILARQDQGLQVKSSE